MKLRCILGVHKYLYSLKEVAVIFTDGKTDKIKVIRRECKYCKKYQGKVTRSINEIWRNCDSELS